MKKEDMSCFSFREYTEILKNLPGERLTTFLKAYETWKDQRDFSRVDFIVLRHDVEISIQKALRLAKLENQQNTISSYFFQLRADGYNILSGYGRDVVKQIAAMGHSIGLHYYVEKKMSRDMLREDIQLDRMTMEKYLDMEIKLFSIHRPPKWILKPPLKIDGMINTYDPLFFRFSTDIKKIFTDSISPLYLADSGHAWKYGYPCNQTINQKRRIQILTHPLSWSEEGFLRTENFKHIVFEKHLETIYVLNRENRDFPVKEVLFDDYL